MKVMLFLFSVLLALPSFAQQLPLPETPETVGLWRFDTDEPEIVYDTSPNPIQGTANNAPLEAIPGADISFGVARRFGQVTSIAEIGVISGSKLDFTNAPEVSVQALIYLTAPANGTHTIFSTDNVRLLVINNQLAGAVRQPGGLFGVVSQRPLQQNTIYRVGVHFKNQELVLSIDGRVDDRATLSHPISAPISSNIRGTIGGNILGEFFPGYVDDVRMESAVGFDIELPEVVKIEPVSFQVSEPKPNFRFSLIDQGSGIDTSTVSIYLNGIQQTNLQISQTEIVGEMNDDLRTGILNEVIINASDLVGNSVLKRFYLTYQEFNSRGEYNTDSSTLALWHMNDFSAVAMADSSGRQRDGIADPRFVSVGEGVFSKGKVLTGQISSLINFDGVRFGQNYTVEGWFYPTANSSSEEILFYNGQITISRYNAGHIRVVYHTTTGTVVFAAPEVLLPVGELHHLAISWDGTSKLDNLLFFVDGVLRNTLTAISQCDFDPTPRVGVIGQYFSGMIDEMRVSSVNRLSFNIPTLDNANITFLSLRNGSSVSEEYPELVATLNSGTSINMSTVKVRLNGIEQTGPGLVITETGITGTFDVPVQVGLNTVEIEFFDNTGNFKKKSQHFFGIRFTGAAEYNPEALTAGLWHFNGDLRDSSTNNSHFTTGSYNPGIGWSETSQKDTVSLNSLNLSCRSFTIEGRYKSTSQDATSYAIWNLSGSNLSNFLYLNPSNGNLQINLNSNSNILDTTANGAFPVDGAYHHVALVYDGSRSYSQLLLLVDGEVKLARDYRMTCDQGVNYFFSLGYFQPRFEMDEFRVSREAKYAFNIQKPGTGRPVLAGVSPAPDTTFYQESVQLSFNAEDAVGVDVSRTKLFLNEVEVPLVASNKSRFVTNFTADLSLVLGDNKIRISVINSSGNEIAQTLSFYRLSSLPPAPYTVDAFTTLLFNFDEASGPFVNAVGNTGTQSSTSWTQGLVGVFGLAASSNSHSDALQIANINAITSHTFEFWLKRSVAASNGPITVSRDSGPLFYFSSDKKVIFRFEKTGDTLTWDIPAEFDDLEYHHYALIVDASTIRKNVLLVIDGKVVGAAKVPSTRIGFSTSPSFYMARQLYNSEFDEFRFSTEARYQLVFTRE